MIAAQRKIEKKRTLLQTWPIATLHKKSVVIWCVFTICDAYFVSVAIGYEFLFLKMWKKKKLD